MKRLAPLVLAAIALAPGPPPGKGKPQSQGYFSSLAFLQPVLLGGRPFPRVSPFVVQPVQYRRTLVVAPGKDAGDGTDAHPWSDLQAALCALSPGDQLRVRAGDYSGPLAIDGACRDGTDAAPIAVLFDPKSAVRGSGERAALLIRKAHWRVERLFVRLGQSEAPGLVIGSTDVIVERARISGGRGPGVFIESDASKVTIANSLIAKEQISLTGPASFGPASFGIEVAAGARDILVTNTQLHHNPAGSIRVEGGAIPVRNFALSASTIHDDKSPAIAIDAGQGVRIADNTIVQDPRSKESRGIVLGQTKDVRIEGNEIAGCALAIRVGRQAADGSAVSAAEDIAIERNHLEGLLSGESGVAIEAGRRIRVVKNLFENLAAGILVLGKPPRTGEVTVANNLVLGISEVAFVLADPKASPLFDYNIFSPRGTAVVVEVGGKRLDPSRFLKRGTMPHTRLVPGVTLFHRDLARVLGVETVDQGKALDGIVFQGAAPDIGIAEQ